MGPYQIVEKVGRSAYRLQTPGRSTRHATFNESLLKPHIPGEFPEQIKEPPPPPELRDGSEEWEVESIKDSRFYRNQLQYLVHWQGYDISEDSWEPAINLEHAQEVVQEYHLANPTRPKPRRQIKSRGRDSLRGGNVTNPINLLLLHPLPLLFVLSAIYFLS